MRTPFTQTERDFLTSNGWEVKGEAVADKGYMKINKLYDEEFEVETLVIADEDHNDYWEWDSSWTTVEKAVARGRTA